MTKIRIPAHLLSTATELGLKSWIKKKPFPMNDYCETIEDTKDLISTHLKIDPDQVSDEAVISTLATILDEEGALLDHVLNGAKAKVDDPEDWAKCCQAAAWVVVQKYYLMKSKGEWPK